MKTFKILLTSILVSSLFSCQDNSGGMEKGTPENIYLHVAVSVPATRAEVEAVPENYKSEVGDHSYIFVIDELGNVVGAPQLFVPNGDLNEMAFETTNAAASVLFLANLPSGYEPYPFTTRAALEKEVFLMQNLAPAAYDEEEDPYGVRYAMMYNVSLPAIDKSNEEEWKVNVTIAPVVARLEIGEIAADAPLTPEQAAAGHVGIESFDLAAIYIYNIYTGLTLEGGVNDILLDGDITTRTIDWSCDMPSLSSSEDKNIIPEVGVWAYHVAPVLGFDSIPYIALELTDVVFEDDTRADKLYVTITSYTDGTGSMLVNEFKSANVYHIDKISFNRTHLTTVVNPEEIGITAEVTVKEWKINNLKPNI